MELYELADGSERKLVADVTTNADGRTDKPLMSADQARAGKFELIFHAGDYFRRRRAELADPPFLDVIPIRFGVADPRRTITCPSSSRPGAIRPIGEVEIVAPAAATPGVTCARSDRIGLGCF